MKEIDLWIFIYNKLNKKLKVTLLLVADSSNSSPGKSGFKMAVSEDVETIGSIGGGIMEFDILKEVSGIMTSNKPVNFVRKLHHKKGDDVESSGLICGGTQTLIVTSIYRKHIDIVKEIIDNLEEQNNGLLIINQNGLSYKKEKENFEQIVLHYYDENNWQYEENIGLSNTIYIIGGGHVGLAVSRIMSTLDFYVIVFDERDDVITMRNNTFANKKIITAYKDVGNFIKETNKSYIVIVTPNHDGDKTALQSVINKNVKYIGLMGSKKKSKSIFNLLQKEGIAPELLKKVNTPVGLEIEAESPEEIAVSIAAEIIKIKNTPLYS